MNIVKLRKELDILHREVSNANLNRDHITREVLFRLIEYNRMLLTEFVEYEPTVEERFVSKEEGNLEKQFINGVYEIINNGATLNVDILNWYRNLYYKEDSNTERGIMARVINNLFNEMKTKGIDLAGLYVSPAE